MIHLPDWTPAEQAQHRRDLLAVVHNSNKGRRRPRREHQPTEWTTPPTTEATPKEGYASGSTLEELLTAW